MENESQIGARLSEPPAGVAAVRAFYEPRELVTVATRCGSRTFDITCHVKAAPNIVRFFEEVTARGLAGLIHSYDGCFVDRPKRLSSEPSMHSYGAAFDINASTNEQGTAGNMPPQVVAVARALGFFWGGDFKGRYRDAMHFQLGTDFPLDGRPAPRVSALPDHAGVSALPGHPGAPPEHPAPAADSPRLYGAVGIGADGARHREVPACVKVEGGHAWLRADALGVLLGDIAVSFESAPDGSELTLREAQAAR